MSFAVAAGGFRKIWVEGARTSRLPTCGHGETSWAMSARSLQSTRLSSGSVSGSFIRSEPVALSSAISHASLSSLWALSLMDLFRASALWASESSDGAWSARGSLGGVAVRSFRAALRRV